LLKALVPENEGSQVSNEMNVTVCERGLWRKRGHVGVFVLWVVFISIPGARVCLVCL